MQLTDVGSVDQLLGPQQHPVAHFQVEYRVDPAQVAAERRHGVVDGKHGERQVTVLVVLAAVGVRAQRVADDAVGQLYRDLGVGLLLVCQADYEARAPALDEGTEHLAGEVGAVVHHEHSGKPSQDAGTCRE